MQKYGPTQPIRVLVAELNKLYHEREAEVYESTHPEIFEQLPGKWQEMLRLVDLLYGSKEPLRILDFGCGTGFEARQCLERFEPGRVEGVVCYDPSHRMLDRCRATLANWRGKVEFFSDLEALRGDFNVLATNSVLHHLLDPVMAIRELARLLSPEAIWLCGHEPSRRFVGNPACRAVLGRFRSSDRWQRLFSPRRYGRRLLRLTGLAERPEDYAARRAFEQALFERRPPGRLISGLVDFHVVEEESGLTEAKGLDFRRFQSDFAGEWDLVWWRTYSFMGSHYEGRLSARWQAAARELSEKYPDDGANSCLVWRRSKTRFAK